MATNKRKTKAAASKNAEPQQSEAKEVRPEEAEEAVTRAAASAKREETPESCSDPVPVDKATDEAYNALFPWLAQGFTPIKTTHGNHHGIRALWRAIREAREAMKTTEKEKIGHASQPTMISWMGSDSYSNKVDELLRGADYRSLSKQEVDDARADLMEYNDSNLTKEQIKLLLQIYNEKFDTSFVVGFVTQGWRCKFRRKKKWDHTYVKNTSIELDAGTLKSPARPYRDSHRKPESVFDRQWEGFGRSEKKSNESRRNLVQQWNLGRRVKRDVEKGLWMVTEVRTGSNYLKVLPGHFVRETNARGQRLAKCRFVKTCNGVEGNVLEAILRKIELHPNFLAPGDPIPEEKDESAARRPKVGQAPESAGETVQPSERRGLPGVMIYFWIYRIVQATNKVGGEANNDDFDIEGFTAANGEFLRQLGNRNSTGPQSVTDIKGYKGQFAMRRLQALMEPLWGLPEKLPELPSLEVNKESSIADVKKACLARALSTTGTQNDLLRSIQAWENEQSTGISLQELTKAYEADHVGKDFLKREIVRRVPGTEHEASSTVTVMDYQGNSMIVKEADLRHLVLGDEGHGVPFGLRLDPYQLPTECGGRQSRATAEPAEKTTKNTVKGAVKEKEVERYFSDAGLDVKKRANIKRRRSISEEENPHNTRSKGGIRPAKRPNI